MKIVYVLGILLVTTLNSIASGNVIIPQDTSKPASPPVEEVTAAVPSATSIKPSASTISAPNITSIPSNPIINGTSDRNSSVPSDTTTPTAITTVLPTKTSVPTTITQITPTTLPPSKATEPPSNNITTVPTVTVTHSTVSPTTSHPVTTPVPPSTKADQSNQGRHFDGLSFLGGIILVVCLTTIGLLVWKLHRSMNEQQYRTL